MAPVDGQMSSMRPFLVVALRDWIIANDMTPHLKASTKWPGVILPGHLVSAHEEIVLNVGPRAVSGFRCEDHGISFGATFNHTYSSIFIPYGAIQAVYARETGRGMEMPEEIMTPSDDDGAARSPADNGARKGGKSRAHLRVVK